MNRDCCFTDSGNWFRYRAAAMIVENGCVLLIGNEKENYLYSVGGGVHMNETAEDAVVREVMEETGATYEIDRLAVIHENFWTGNGSFDQGLSCHEIAFYFLMKPKGFQMENTDSVTRFSVPESLHWIPISELHLYKHFPSFLQNYLQNPTQGVVHIVSDERKK